MNKDPESEAARLRAILKKHWGYDDFRELQLDIMLNAMAGHDTLALMPTGGGKSICFQVPALALGGLCIVVTPLVSLMKDQVDNLRRRNISAVFLHAGMTNHERTVAWERIASGRCRFLYVSPERLESESFMREVRQLDIRLIVVDEAHCISQWGYDFRPPYLRIARLRKLHPGVPVMALTATATPRVADDICRILEFRNGYRVLRKSFSRPNISYVVRHTQDKLYMLATIFRAVPGSGIVYVRSRKATAEIANALAGEGISASNFHAGLPFDQKEQRMEAWRNGRIRVMVATNAFGMGIDKPDVRVVAHYALLPSLEEYYQEAGRAGRDGLPSYAVLLNDKHDIGVLRARLTRSFPEKEVVRKIYDRVLNFLHISHGEGYRAYKEFDIEKFCETFSYNTQTVQAALAILNGSGYLTYLPEPEARTRVMIVVEREELYHLEVSERAEALLTSLLRNYTGLFAEYQPISETLLSQQLGIGTRDIYELLLELQRAGVLRFIPRSAVPHIYVPTAREDSDLIVISRESYEVRREVLRRRVEAMVSYVSESKKCRVEGMLAYFGEEHSAPCGTCDICRDSRGRNAAAAKKESVRSRVIGFLSEVGRPVPIREFHARFSGNDEAFNVLRQLEAEECLRIDMLDQKIYLNN